MLRFITLTFLMLGFAFWEASGGAEFSAPGAANAAPIIAESRATVPDAFEDRLSGVAALDAIEAAVRAAAPVPDSVVAIVDALPVEIVSRAATDFAAPAAPAPMALREVTGSRVNMRQGPSTSFPVVTVLTRGTVAEVIDDAGNWSQIRTEDGTIGWMANALMRDV